MITTPADPDSHRHCNVTAKALLDLRHTPVMVGSRKTPLCYNNNNTTFEIAPGLKNYVSQWVTPTYLDWVGSSSAWYLSE